MATDRMGEDLSSQVAVLRHSAAHILAQAVKTIFPEVKLGIGPPIASGFYYDFDKSTPFTDEDLAKIEKQMGKIIKADLPFLRSEVSKEEALEIFNDLGEGYKLELLREIEDGKVTIYRQGDLTDLCRGPHLSSTGKVKAFKLLNVAGAYWKGSEANPMLQRIYGTAFPSEEELQEYLERLEEAKKRDHRKLGKELDLYSLQDETGAGLVLWHPKGAILRKVIEDFWTEEHLKRGYDLVYTPHIARMKLWERSGHLDHYRELMYPPIDVEGQKYLIKPMNCPFHIQIYKSKLRSYRDLPIRYAELGTVYRYELSGVLHGLLRVRGFTQDDAHIFCTPEGLLDEIVGVVELAISMLETFGYRQFNVDLSVRDPARKEEYMGDDEGWEQAEAALTEALKMKGLHYVRKEGEAVFYGPKIDIKLVDALGRGWQGTTIQFDFNLPRKMGVTYIGVDGKEHHPVMVHRAILGAIERFVGGLVEHYGGAFPTWLAPVQAKVLTVTDAQNCYAVEVAETLKKAGLRVETDLSKEKIGHKIREAEMEKVPYMLIVGAKEVETGEVAVRKRRKGDCGRVKVDDLLSELKREVALKNP